MLTEFKQYLDRLSPRDRHMLLLMAAVLTVTLVGLGGLKLHRAAEKAQQQAMQERDTLSWLHSVATRLSGGGVANGGLSVLDTISSAAAGQGIVMQRFEPDGDSVRVWLEGADFAKVAGWMDTLERQGVKTLEVHFEHSEKGLNVRLVFGRP